MKYLFEYWDKVSIRVLTDYIMHFALKIGKCDVCIVMC